MTEPKVYSVSQINRYIKGLVENDFILNGFWVKGEISNFKAHSSGHLYFTLKDEGGAVNAIMFKDMAELMPYTLQNGMEVMVCGYVSVYEKTGQYQVYAQIISPLGKGELTVAYEQLKEQLNNEGLFDDDFKREIPEFSSCIAVITSPTGAAVRDIINVATRRNPNIEIKIIPTLVQGNYAADSIVSAIKLVNQWGKADVIILGRGGGSIEDLWAFNEEKVARAIFASETPVISAVGHETDFTIADFVSDLRAPTPSAAAEIATSDISADRERAIDVINGLNYAFNNIFEEYKNRLETFYSRPVIKRPLDKIINNMFYVDNIEEKLTKEINYKTEKSKHLFVNNIEKLETLSPLAVLKRGYSMVTNNNLQVINSVDMITENQDINIRVNDGEIKALVKGKVKLNG